MFNFIILVQTKNRYEGFQQCITKGGLCIVSSRLSLREAPFPRVSNYCCHLFLMSWFGSFLRCANVNVSAFAMSQVSAGQLQGQMAKCACWCEKGRDCEN